MRICIIYDCLYPHTVGGAERWYRNLAERLVACDHEVTYLTLCQWQRGERPDVDPRVKVRAVGPRMALYARERRRILPPLLFGLGVLVHLLRHRHDYDVVHTAATPYFSLLAAGAVRLLARFELIVDWHELWSRGYWREYLGPVQGEIGYAVQRASARLPQRAFCFSQLHASRLRKAGLRGTVTVLEGEYAGSAFRPGSAPWSGSVPRSGSASRPGSAFRPGSASRPDFAPRPGSAFRPSSASRPIVRPAERLVVFAGRLIPEKRAPLAVEAFALAAGRIPELSGVFYGDGPQREDLLQAIARHGVAAMVSAPGFVTDREVDAVMRRALCMLSTSRREGYGMVVVEAAARATPSIVVAGPDNAATELIEPGANGFVVPVADAAAIAAAIVRVYEAGIALRESTASWFALNARRLSLQSSLDTVLDGYRNEVSRTRSAAPGIASSARSRSRSSPSSSSPSPPSSSSSSSSSVPFS